MGTHIYMACMLPSSTSHTNMLRNIFHEPIRQAYFLTGAPIGKTITTSLVWPCALAPTTEVAVVLALVALALAPTSELALALALVALAPTTEDALVLELVALVTTTEAAQALALVAGAEGSRADDTDNSWTSERCTRPPAQTCPVVSQKTNEQ